MTVRLLNWPICSDSVGDGADRGLNLSLPLWGVGCLALGVLERDKLKMSEAFRHRGVRHGSRCTAWL